MQGWRRRTLLGSILLLCSLLGAGGGLQLAGSYTRQTLLASLQLRLHLSVHHPGLQFYVPLTDWGMRARVWTTPVQVQLEPRALQREQIVAAVQDDPQRALSRQVQSMRRAVRLEVLRAGGWTLLGALVGGLLALLVWERLGVRGRRLLLAPLGALGITALLIGGLVLWGAASYDLEQLQDPTYYAAGPELSDLLEQAEGLRRSAGRYSNQAEGAVRSLAALVAQTGLAAPERPGPRAVVASDLHDNALAVPVLQSYARGLPVFMPGDLAVNGSPMEQSLLQGLEEVGQPLVMVSGNHDSTALMQRFAADGAVVLTHRGRLDRQGRARGPATVAVAGLQVAGFEDPLQFQGEPQGLRRALSYPDLPDGRRRERQALQQRWRWWLALPRRPDVLLMHQASMARALARRIAERDPGKPLVILSGHTHHQRLDRIGDVTVIDDGTIGAGGPLGAGKDDLGLGVLHFAGQELAAADLVRVNPRNGQAQARRVPIDHPGCDQRLVFCGS